MKKALLITLLLGATLGTAAQQKFKIIYGSLENSFTRKAVIGAKAELLLPDSTVIDSMRIREDLDVDQTPSAWFLRTRGSGKYILRFSHESYDTQYVNVNLHFHRREVAIDHGAVLLRRPSREVKLGEVVVRATRIKFFQHGDTMVYNADAFQTPSSTPGTDSPSSNTASSSPSTRTSTTANTTHPNRISPALSPATLPSVSVLPWPTPSPHRRPAPCSAASPSTVRCGP